MNYEAQIDQQDVYISFIQSFIKLYLSFINLLIFFHETTQIYSKTGYRLREKKS